MKQLRDYGIYNLPHSDRSLYLVAHEDGTYSLYDCQFSSRIPPRFTIDEKGNLFNWYKDFPVWTIDDLIDTGETYENNLLAADIASPILL